MRDFREREGATHPSNGRSRDQAVAPRPRISLDFYRRHATTRIPGEKWAVTEKFRDKEKRTMDGHEKLQ